MNIDIRLAALHKHWVTADSVQYHVRRSIKDPEEVLSEGMRKLGTVLSASFALSVWYSLLYVVVEGYRALGFHDSRVDELLAQEEFVSALRRFRNATFHYQEDPLSEKLMEFFTAEGSDVWIRELNRSFKIFFERELRIAEMIARQLSR